MAKSQKGIKGQKGASARADGAHKIDASNRPRGLTTAGQKVFLFMKNMKIKGNFRDHVLFIGPKIYDYSGEYDCIRPDMEEGQKAYIALLHKKDLHEVIGEKEAEKFWSQKLKTRNNSLAHSRGWNEHQRRASLGMPPVLGADYNG